MQLHAVGKGGSPLAPFVTRYQRQVSTHAVFMELSCLWAGLQEALLLLLAVGKGGSPSATRSLGAGTCASALDIHVCFLVYEFETQAF